MLREMLQANKSLNRTRVVRKGSVKANRLRALRARRARVRADVSFYNPTDVKKAEKAVERAIAEVEDFAGVVGACIEDMENHLKDAQEALYEIQNWDKVANLEDKLGIDYNPADDVLKIYPRKCLGQLEIIKALCDKKFKAIEKFVKIAESR